MIQAALEAGLKLPDQIDEAFLTSILAARSAAGDSPRSRARMLSGWRGFFRYLLEEEELIDDPSARLSNPKCRRGLGIAFQNRNGTHQYQRPPNILFGLNISL